SAPLSAKAVKWLYFGEPWNMVEVFLLGVIVSLLKLDQVAEVSINAGFWCFAGVMFCLAATLAGIDRRELWDRVEIAAGAAMEEPDSKPKPAKSPEPS
ncbi:MAG: paraquat-inducible protein A, partial [Akkermansiaceae bacterium]|nr:paraquat-inducible protein A [Akkermansiaceae bacterium]